MPKKQNQINRPNGFCLHVVHAERQILLLWLLRITSSCFKCIAVVSAADVIPAGHGAFYRQTLPSRTWRSVFIEHVTEWPYILTFHGHHDRWSIKPIFGDHLCLL